MKRLGRWLFNFAAAVSLGIFVAIAMIWVRSRSTLDEWSLVDRANRVWAAISYQGAIHLFRTSIGTSMPRSIGWDTQKIPDGVDSANLYGPSITNWKFLGVEITSKPVKSSYGPPAGSSRGIVVLPQPRMPQLVPWLSFAPYEAVAIPYGLLCIPWSIFIAIATRRWCVRWYRKRHCLCLDCGYDLRATPDRCPECGAIPTAAKGSAA